MSYDVVWGIPFKELRKAGFRSFTDQAWAGVKSKAELDDLFERAAKQGMTVVVPISRGEVHGRFKYSCDLSTFHEREPGFTWSLVPFNDLTPEELKQPPWQNNHNQSPSRRFGFALFKSERDAVAWKLMVG